MPRTGQTGAMSPSARRRAAGFTLIEILVVMVILGVLATGVALVLPDTAERQREQRVQALLRQARQAARFAEVRGIAHAWQLDGGLARIQERPADDWLDLDAVAAKPLVFGTELALAALEVEGQTGSATRGRVVFLPGEPPLFAVSLTGGGRTWRIEGLPSGVIRVGDGAPRQG